MKGLLQELKEAGFGELIALWIKLMVTLDIAFIILGVAYFILALLLSLILGLPLLLSNPSAIP